MINVQLLESVRTKSVRLQIGQADAYSGTLTQNTKWNRFAEDLGLDGFHLLNAVTEARDDPRIDDGVFYDIDDNQIPYEVRIPDPSYPINGKQRRDPRNSAQAYDNWRVAFDTLPEGLNKTQSYDLSWREREHLAVVDVDFHGVDAPRPSVLLAIGASIEPRPAAYWLSHGRGLHLLYTASHPYQADELAATALLALHNDDSIRGCSLELLTRTAHPGHAYTTESGIRREAGEVQYGPRSPAIDLPIWLGGDEDDAAPVPEPVVQQWLENRGLSIGRHSHECCPFHPRPTQGAEPVMVGANGIICYVCGKKADWAKLTGRVTRSSIVEAAQSWATFAQALPLIRLHLGKRFTKPIIRSLYGACLRALHDPEDPRISRALNTAYSLIPDEAGGLWFDPVTGQSRLQVLQAALREYPSARRAKRSDRGWKESVDCAALDRMVNCCQLPGLPRIRKIRGVALAESSYTNDAVPYVVPCARRDQYPPDLNVTDDLLAQREARAEIERALPGLDFRYLDLLIACRYFSERGSARPLIVAVDGPSGSGKTQTAQFAAVLCGTDTEAVSEESDQRWFESVGYAISDYVFLCLNEFAKFVGSDSSHPRCTWLLGVDREARVRKLYQGPQSVPVRAAIVLTDTSFGTLFDDAQLARRILRVHLPNRTADWTLTCPGGNLNLWREDRDRARLADIYLRSVVTRASQYDTLFEFARTLDIVVATEENEQQVQETGGKTLVERRIHDLFQYVLYGPQAANKPRGFVTIDMSHPSQGSEVWRMLCDNSGTSAGLLSSRVISELDLSRTLDLDGPCRLQVEAGDAKSILAVRFVDTLAGVPTKVNGQLRREGAPPPTPGEAIIPIPVPPPPLRPVGPSDNGNGSHATATATREDVTTQAKRSPIRFDVETDPGEEPEKTEEAAFVVSRGHVAPPPADDLAEILKMVEDLDS